MKYLVLIALMCVSIVTIRTSAQQQAPPAPAKYCNWVLATPGPWPPCAGGMRSRRTPWVSSSPDCTPEGPQPMDLEETEACTDGADTLPDVHLFIHVPYGTRFTTVYLSDTVGCNRMLTPIIALEGVSIYR